MRSFYAHDDYISKLLFHNGQVASVSEDKTIKLWDITAPMDVFKRENQDYPITLYDHQAPIISADLIRTVKDP